MATKDKFKAVIFDLDGVITKTALVHSAAWKKMFDEYLLQWSGKTGEEYIEFRHEQDYLPFVDGKPRYKGVESFLKSRGIEIPLGNPDNDPGMETICGLGNRKNQAFNEVLERDGVQVYESTITLIRELIKKGIRVGVASSSKNCKAVLEKTGLLELMETRVDGVVSAELGLQGKPEADIFTVASDNLKIPYDRAVVVEDAVSGVQAGAKGNFGLVIGVARENNENELRQNGADIVVPDLEEIDVNRIEKWFTKGLEEDSWSVSYHQYDRDREKSRESLHTIGNGYFGTRGAFEEPKVTETNYPGTYIAGLYNRLTSQVADRKIENEDFVNCPNWLPVQFKLDNEEWSDFTHGIFSEFSRKLNLSNGLLERDLTILDKAGRMTRVVSKRLAAMDNCHLASMQYTITPLNYDAKITVRAGLDGNHINDGVARYRQLNQNHLKPVRGGGNSNEMFLLVSTTQSDIQIAEYAKLHIKLGDETIHPDFNIKTSSAAVYNEFEIDVRKEQSLITEKSVAIFTSQPWDSPTPLESAKELIETVGNFDEILSKSCKKWKEIWDKIDIRIVGDRQAQKLIRLHLYHQMVSFSPHNVNIDASITARGLHGEAYRGHIFWDELFILPLYNLHFPEVTRAALMYRYRRLDKAKEYAAEFGHKGAMYPWQSGSSGREETPVIHLNPVTGKWGPDFSSLQRHVSLAITWNIWNYFHSTNDKDFISRFGLEMYLEICRFWADKCKLNKETERYSIESVMGPDEFHEKYQDSSGGGLRDNTYTNIMVVWTLGKAFELINILEQQQWDEIRKKIALSEEELLRWKDIMQKINIVIEDDIMAQYDGYFDLKELDWDYFRQKYGNIYRMDRLLKAEGQTADAYKVAKQADTLQVIFNLDSNEVSGILNGLGYQLSKDFVDKNLEYYLQRTSHGSTLSRVVHARLANMIGRKKLSWELYLDALTSDYNDIQGGTTAEGIHAGVMAGTILIALQSYAGLDLKGERIRFEPRLPPHWRSIHFSFGFRSFNFSCFINRRMIKISQTSRENLETDIEIFGEIFTLKPSEKYQIPLRYQE